MMHKAFWKQRGVSGKEHHSKAHTKSEGNLGRETHGGVPSLAAGESTAAAAAATRRGGGVCAGAESTAGTEEVNVASHPLFSSGAGRNGGMGQHTVVHGKTKKVIG